MPFLTRLSCLHLTVTLSILAPSFPGLRTEASAAAPPGGANLALIATASTSFVSGHETLGALNDGAEPRHSDDKSHGAYGNWPRTGTQWVQYEWSQPVSINRVDVYWFDDRRGVRLPKACRLLYWNGSAFVPVPNPQGLGLAEHRFNTTTFDEVTTTRLRLECDGADRSSTGILEWRVYDTGKSPNFAPVAEAGPDRIVVLPGTTWLNGAARDDGKPGPSLKVQWARTSGPGRIRFDKPTALETTARFSRPGDYRVTLTANDGRLSAEDHLQVRVMPPPPARPLDMVWPVPWQVSGPLWPARLKTVVTQWIPHCVRKIEDPATREGGLANFVEAAKKLSGQPARHTGPVFANTWVYNTLEAACLAVMLDAQGDPEVAAAQAMLRRTINDWIPKILSAQEPDGYIHTMYTIQGIKRWSNKHDHEGYQAGYFLEAAMAHCLMTEGKDTRMIEAARRLADCWVNNIGPAPKRAWYEGHQELEQALVRFAHFIEKREGPGKGRPYIELARFLLDSRKNGEEYDQSHLPVTRQYEAVGHAVRAAYSYAGMADIAMATGDPDYRSAVQSLWNSIVNRKYYVTGGIGSGETSEGFGKDYSLPNNAYCESCANCGELFFQHKLQRLWHDARYADLYEETLFNAILGDLDLEGKNFTYTNPLDSSARRYPWHGCPCCVGNIPRTLLMLPTWAYTRTKDEIFVNLFLGSALTLNDVAGTSVRLEQRTDYPWNGKVALTVTPATSARFTLRIRVPNRQTSELYTNTPPVSGLSRLALNGKGLQPRIEHGYAVLTRLWQPGDTVEWEVPMPVQRIRAHDRVAANRGRTALRYGPLIYNIESVDQDLETSLPAEKPLATEWRPDLLGGVVVIKGTWADGKPLLAIPNYARLNRGGRSLVWMKTQ